MKAVLAWLGLGLLAYGIILVLLFPAASLVGWAAPYAPGLQVADVEGKALAGQARDLRYQGMTLESLEWRFDPLALLGLRLGARLHAREPQLDVTANASVGLDRDLRLADLEGRVSLPRAGTLFRLPPLPLDGALELDLERLAVDGAQRPTAAEGEVRLVNARTTLGRALQLGSFRADLETTDEGIVGQVSDEGGPVVVDGRVTLAPDGRYRFAGFISAREDAEPQLQQVLRILGRPDAQGRWRVDINGRI